MLRCICFSHVQGYGWNRLWRAGDFNKYIPCITRKLSVLIIPAFHLWRPLFIFNLKTLQEGIFSAVSHQFITCVNSLVSLVGQPGSYKCVTGCDHYFEVETNSKRLKKKKQSICWQSLIGPSEMPSALPQHSRHDTLLNIEQLNRTVTSVGTLLTSNRKLLRSVAVGGTLNQFIIPPPQICPGCSGCLFVRSVKCLIEETVFCFMLSVLTLTQHTGIRYSWMLKWKVRMVTTCS